MDQYLYKYLVLNKHICIPQLGSFLVQKEQARYDESTGLLHPPTENFIFSDGVIPASEKLFFDFLANEMSVDDISAIKQFHDFSYTFRTQLNEQGSATLKGIGRLTKNEHNAFVFEPAPRLNDLYPSLHNDGSIATLTEETFEEETVETNKDNWWIYAIVLLIIGAGALLFYYS